MVRVLNGIPQQRQVIPPAQHKIQRLHGAALPDMDAHLLHPGCPFQEIHRSIGSIGGMGDHDSQLGTALLLLLHALVQAVHLFQDPGGLLNEMPPLLRGDHTGRRALKNAQVIFFFQIFQRLAHIGLGRVQLLGSSAHRAPLHDGYQISQFGNVHAFLSLALGNQIWFYCISCRNALSRKSN